jgi:GNAT superfamily N-acetyltransferase
MTSVPVIVRGARPTDVAAIGETHAEAWRAGYVEMFEPGDLMRLVEDRRTRRWPTTFDAPWFASTTLLVAERSNSVVGFLHFGPSRTEPPVCGEIYSFNVHPAEWGTDVATALMRATLESLAERAVPRVHLWTFRDAARARRFYEKTGFESTGRTKTEGPVGGPPITEIEYTRTTGS